MRSRFLQTYAIPIVAMLAAVPACAAQKTLDESRAKVLIEAALRPKAFTLRAFDDAIVPLMSSSGKPPADIIQALIKEGFVIQSATVQTSGTTYTYAFSPEVRTSSSGIEFGRYEVENVSNVHLDGETRATATFAWKVSLNRLGDFLASHGPLSGNGTARFGTKPDGSWKLVASIEPGLSDQERAMVDRDTARTQAAARPTAVASQPSRLGYPSHAEVQACINSSRDETIRGGPLEGLEFGTSTTSQGGTLELGMGAVKGTKMFAVKYNLRTTGGNPFERTIWMFKDSFEKWRCVGAN